MRLVVGVNHAAPIHVGGSEKVVQQITESMTNDYGMDCHILTHFSNKKIIHNGVTIHPMVQDPEGYIRQLNSLKPDHFFVYSDSFMQWETTLRRADSIKCPKSIAMVGMNHMRSIPEITRIFRKNHKHFNVITHSNNYLDYQASRAAGADVTVIPNAIDLNEFKDKGFSFREKYNIPDKPMILCVSNFFPGKGQEHLMHILKKLKSMGKDFVAVFICASVNFQPASVMRHRHKEALKKVSFDNRLLTDIPREDTVQAFLEADIFAFPSQVEVAPLVALEAMASKTPWVSLNVGNMSMLNGGYIVNGGRKVSGKFIYQSSMYDDFTDNLYTLLSDKSIRDKKAQEGYEQIINEFDWEKVKKQYHDIFTISREN